MTRPGNDDGPTVAAAGHQGVAQAVSLNSATSGPYDKAFQTLRAQLALEGHTLSRTDAGDGLCSYFVSRWGMVRELRDIEAVRAFARQVGVTHG